MTYTNPKKACSTYQKNDVTTLAPVQIVARLYLALDRDLNEAKQAGIAGKKTLMGEKISHALAIIGELQTGLDFDKGGEISVNLNSLHNFFFAEISKANLTKNGDGLTTAIETLQPLVEAWSELALTKKAKVAPKMGAKPMIATSAVAFHATF